MKLDLVDGKISKFGVRAGVELVPMQPTNPQELRAVSSLRFPQSSDDVESFCPSAAGCTPIHPHSPTATATGNGQ